MESFKVHILGCGSALPTLKHNPSAQAVDIGNRLYLVDCGEGTQLALRRSHLPFARISAVFISHLHGDHCLGLVGMICSLGMLGRTADLHVYATSEYEPMLYSQLSMFANDLSFSVVFHGVDTERNIVVYEDNKVTVETIPLEHRIPCCGYLFREKPSLPHIRRDMIDFYSIPNSQINNIKNGADWMLENGEIIPNHRLVSAPSPVRSYAYCSDTRYMPELHRLVEGVNVLYHESTYDKGKMDLAGRFYHSTAEQAALVARNAHAGKLILGHYSARYSDEEMLLKEARDVFPNAELSNEGMSIDVK